jgi:hypothetical protein
MCSMHYTRWTKYGDPSVVGVAKQGGAARCRFDGCNRTAKAKGFCNGHYAFVRYDAEREHLLNEEDRAPRCLFPGCENPMSFGGLCRSHEGQASRGNLELPTENTVRLRGFGERMRLARVRKGWTLEDSGREVGVTRGRVFQIEQRTKPPRQTWRIKKFADAYGVEMEWLLGHEETQDPEPPKTPRGFGKKGCPFCSGSGAVFAGRSG